MKRFVLIIGLSILLVSCATENKVKNRDLVKMDSAITKTFVNMDFLKHEQTLTSLFEMNPEVDNLVSVSFDKEKVLRISYKDGKGIIRYKEFKGKFKKRYFEVYFEKYRKNIPLIISKTQIRRVRIKMTKDSVLVAEKYINRSGSIFLMAAGSSYTNHYQFQPIKNK